MTYTKLDSGITKSTIWQAPDATRLVWITLLACADQHGYVGASMPGLANTARVSLQACIEAIAHLEGPDEWSRTKDHDGRRIAPADGGWLLLNHAKYREKQSEEDRKERARIAMAELRQSRKLAKQLAFVSSRDHPLTKLAQAEADTEADTEEISGLSTNPRPLASPPDPTAGQQKPAIPCPYGDIVDAYHAALPSLPMVRLRDGPTWVDRQKAMRAFWGWVLSSRKSDGTPRATTGNEAMIWVAGYFARAGQNDFVMGRTARSATHENWRADFDFLLSKKGVKNVIERTLEKAA